MNYKNIIIEKKNNITTIIINRPQVLNALNIETLEELLNGVQELENDPTIQVAIITGKEKAFIAGADIKQMQGMKPWGTHCAESAQPWDSVFPVGNRRLHHFPRPFAKAAATPAAPSV